MPRRASVVVANEFAGLSETTSMRYGIVTFAECRTQNPNPRLTILPMILLMSSEADLEGAQYRLLVVHTDYANVESPNQQYFTFSNATRTIVAAC